MKKRVLEISLYAFGILVIIFGIVSDFLRGRPFLLGWSQIGLILIGAGIIYCGFLARKNLLIPILAALVAKLKQFLRIIEKCIDFLEKHSWISLVLLIVAIILMVWPTPESYYSPDVAYYLSLAKNVFYGNGYVNPDLSPALYRGPVFPLLISFSYFLFGNVFRSALIMMRIFWVLTILITYLIGKEFFNHRVGLLAAVFVLTAGVINFIYKYIWTDGVVTFLILVIQLLIWIVLKKKRNIWWWVLIGFLMGIAYFVKQTAIIIVPLPFLIWALIPEFRTRQLFKRMLVCSVVFALFFFGWMGYIYLAGGSAGQVTRDLSVGSSILAYLTNAFSNLTSKAPAVANVVAADRSASPLQILSVFFTRDIASYFWYTLLFPVALLFSLGQAVIKKIKPDIFLLSGLLLFSSLIPSSVVVNYGPRQNLYFYIIVLICIAALLDRLFKNLPKIISSFLVLSIAFGMVYFQSFNNGVPNAPASVNQNTLDYFQEYSKLAEWIDENIKPNENILAGERKSNILHILTQGNRRITGLNTCTGENSFYIAERCDPPYLFLWVNDGITDPNTPRDRIYGITEASLLATIRENDIKYIVVTPNMYFLYNYLNIHPDFERIVILDDVAIFRVKSSVQSLSSYPQIKWETCLGAGTSEYLVNLKELHPATYETKLKNIFEPWMGLTDQDLQNFAKWEGCEFGQGFSGEYEVSQ